MAETTPIGVVYGTRGGGGVLRASQIASTNARYSANQLGTRVWGLDSTASTYFGSWIWVEASGTCTATQCLSLKLQGTTGSAAPTQAQYFIVEQSPLGSGAVNPPVVAGVAETTVATGERFWMRTHGITTLKTVSHTAVSGESQYVGALDAGTAGVAGSAMLALGTYIGGVFATSVLDGSTVTAATVNLHCNFYA